MQGMNIYIRKKTPKTIKKVFTSPNNNVWVISVESDHRAKPKKYM